MLSTKMIADWAEKLKPHQFFPKLNSWLVYYQNQICVEKYYNGFSPIHFHEAQSVTKSIQSILVGIAMQEGFLSDIDVTIKPFFEDYPHIDWVNQRDKITIRDILTMRLGLDWNESKISYNAIDENDANLQMRENDWISYALTKPMIDQRGITFNYSSAAPIFISKIIREVSGIDNETFALRYLFAPLGIEHFIYQKMPKNPFITADIDLLPRDLMKIGILILQKGKWQDRQIISEDWIRESTFPHVKFSENKGYGYFWWSDIIKIDAEEIPYTYAWGIGGQHIFVVPAYELVMVTNARKYEVTLASEPFMILEKLLELIYSNKIGLKR